LLQWAERSGQHQDVRARRGGLRFAFYGRVARCPYRRMIESSFGMAGGVGMGSFGPVLT
jgi:hypothetical protein